MDRFLFIAINLDRGRNWIGLCVTGAEEINAL